MASEGYDTAIQELTHDRIKRQPFHGIKSKIDRVRINKGGSALANMSNAATTANFMAVKPFARSSYGHKLMEDKVQHHKLTFNHGIDSGLAPAQ